MRVQVTDVTMEADRERDIPRDSSAMWRQTERNMPRDRSTMYPILCPQSTAYIIHASLSFCVYLNCVSFVAESVDPSVSLRLFPFLPLIHSSLHPLSASSCFALCLSPLFCFSIFQSVTYYPLDQ